MTIGAFAKAAGVNVETVRFYQRTGLLIAPPRPYGGIRRYGGRDVARVRFVKSAQRLGFTLDEVAQLLRLDDGAHCTEARKLAERKLGARATCMISLVIPWILISIWSAVMPAAVPATLKSISPR